MWDLGAIILIFGINAMMNLFGIMMELHNQTHEEDRLDRLHLRLHRRHRALDRDRRSTSSGSVTSGDAKPPAFVYAIIPTLFVFFNIFAINMVLQYKKVGRWKDYLFGERVYIILSLAAKTALAWLIFAGTLAPV